MTKSHCMEGTKTYDCWVNMKQRCLNKKVATYKHYGGRGIKICKEWLEFSNFYRDMGAIPNGGSIERVNPNGNYCKENCKWIPRKLQARNTRISIFVVLNGERKHLKDWCEHFGLRYETVYQRIKRDNMSPRQALITPMRGKAIRDDQIERNGSAPLQEERKNG